MRKRWPMVMAAAMFFAAGWWTAQQQPNAAWAWQADEVKDPKFEYGMNLQVRLAEEKVFTSASIKYGIEVYRDPHNGNLIYISETGSIAVVPGS